jgi:hypothetical protein
MAINPEDFGVSFKGFLDQMREQKKPVDAPFFVRKLRDHFAAEPAGLPVLSESFPPHDHPNVHLAVEGYAESGGCESELLGVVGQAGYMGKSFSDLVAQTGGPGGAADRGPVHYANVSLDGDRVLACVQRGLYLIPDGDLRLAVYLYFQRLC